MTSTSSTKSLASAKIFIEKLGISRTASGLVLLCMNRRRSRPGPRSSAGSVTRNRLLWPPDIYGWVKYRVDHPPHGITRCRELIAVAVVRVDRYPFVRDGLVDPVLEIAVTYVEKIIAQKHAVRWYPVAHENTEDLAAGFIIGRSVKHERHRSRNAR